MSAVNYLRARTYGEPLEKETIHGDMLGYVYEGEFYYEYQGRLFILEHNTVSSKVLYNPNPCK